MIMKHKNTGLKNKTLKNLSQGLRKASKESGRPIWKGLNKILSDKSRRQRKKVTVNLFKLDKLAKKFKDKTFIVPGKVLGTGKLNEKVKVVAFDFSERAFKKINEKGSAIRMNDFIEKNANEKNLMIIK